MRNLHETDVSARGFRDLCDRFPECQQTRSGDFVHLACMTLLRQLSYDHVRELQNVIQRALIAAKEICRSG